MSSLILYSRHACHLCQLMEAEIQGILSGTQIELEIRDVDAKELWRSNYGAKVPVLIDQSNSILSEFHLDEAKVQAWIKSVAAQS